MTVGTISYVLITNTNTTSKMWLKKGLKIVWY